MRIAVIGASGLLGTALCEQIQNSGYELEAITRTSKNVSIKNCDVVINANGNSKKYLAKQSPLLDFESNVSSTLKYVLDNHGPKQRFVQISSGEIYGKMNILETATENQIKAEEISNYGFSKYMGEEVVKHYADNWVIFRLGGLMGSQVSKGPIYDLLHNLPLRLRSESTLQLLTVTTAARIILKYLTLDAKNEVLNLSSPQALSVQQIANKLSKDYSVAPDAITYHSNLSVAKLSGYVTIPSAEEEIWSLKRELENFK